MGKQIIRQPDGKFALWSSVVDAFAVTDATREELVECILERERRDTEEHVNDVCDKLDRGEPPYNNVAMTMTWEEALELQAEVHGDNPEGTA